MTVSIFAAILLYGTLKSFIIRTFEPSPVTLTVIILAVFLCFFVGTHALLFKLKGGDEESMQAAATLLAHICGFAAMYGFADSHEIEFLEEFGASGLVLIIIASGVIIAGLSYTMYLVMNRVAGAEVDESEQKWMETCEETDDDVFCLAVSFLIVLLCRHLIRGKAQPYEPGEVGRVIQSDANYLLACSAGFGLLVCLGAGIMMKYQDEMHHGSSARRLSTIVQHLNSMIMAWAFLFWAEWQLYVWGWESSVIGGCIVIAVFMTMFGMLCVFLLNFVQVHFRESKVMRRAMNSLELALGVLIGFSWERAFDVAFEEVHHEYHEQAYGEFVVSILAILLFAIVAPAWRLHILPKADKLEREAKMERQSSKLLFAP